MYLSVENYRKILGAWDLSNLNSYTMKLWADNLYSRSYSILWNISTIRNGRFIWISKFGFPVINISQRISKKNMTIQLVKRKLRYTIILCHKDLLVILNSSTMDHGQSAEKYLCILIHVTWIMSIHQSWNMANRYWDHHYVCFIAQAKP